MSEGLKQSLAICGKLLIVTLATLSVIALVVGVAYAGFVVLGPMFVACSSAAAWTLLVAASSYWMGARSRSTPPSNPIQDMKTFIFGDEEDEIEETLHDLAIADRRRGA